LQVKSHLVAATYVITVGEHKKIVLCNEWT
jgi:hypothetical protein